MAGPKQKKKKPLSIQQLLDNKRSEKKATPDAKKKETFSENEPKQNEKKPQERKELSRVEIDELLSSDSDLKISPRIKENKILLQTLYENCSDVIIHDFTIGSTHALLIYVDGLSDTEKINDNILTPLMRVDNEGFPCDLNQIIEKLPTSEAKQIKMFNEIMDQISIGKPSLLIDELEIGYSFGFQMWEQRSIEEPMAESVVQGPREGFVETIAVNIALIRRKIRSPKLKVKNHTIGKYTRTTVAVIYIDGLADDTLIEEIENRLKRIKVDGILESGYIEEFIEDSSFSPFPTTLHTERPDTLSAHLLEGRAAILVDGTPFSTVVPITLYSLFQTEEDYYQRFLISTAIRWLRYIFLVIGLLLPSIYVAVLTFHQEMVPSTLLISIAAARESVPFPVFVEALMMEVTFEILREAGLRLPKQIGSAVSIVGALVIGDAAVSAGIVSAPMVIVVALTGIASFAIPRYNAAIAIRMLRFPIMVLAGILGLLGIILGIILIIIHLSSLRSFGVPYLTPMAPMKGKEMQDVLMRSPWWSLNKRPHLTGKFNKSRQSVNQKPSSKRGKE